MKSSSVSNHKEHKEHEGGQGTAELGFFSLRVLCVFVFFNWFNFPAPPRLRARNPPPLVRSCHASRMRRQIIRPVPRRWHALNDANNPRTPSALREHRGPR
jgi:hypothetical protein